MINPYKGIAYTKYDYESETITFKLDTGGELQADMHHEMICFYGCNSEIEIDFNSDDLKDLMFKINGVIYTALQIAQWSFSNHDEIREEHEQDMRDEEREEKFMSSYKNTGRI
jgi:hypothetical protein